MSVQENTVTYMDCGNLRLIPLFVNEYSHLIGKDEVSIFFIITPSFSNSFNLVDNILGDIVGIFFFISEYLFFSDIPL